MALINNVRDEEERKRRLQEQARQTAEGAAAKAAQQNAEAAKRNSVGTNKPPQQSASETIELAKQKAATGNVSKTPKQYVDYSKYAQKSNPVRQTFNYETLGTQERVMQVARQMAIPEERQQFLQGWANYTQSDTYKAKQKRDAAMTSLSGLYDANGKPININTASYSQVVQGIRSIADSDKRNAAIENLTELTKTEGSRFYGQTIDKALLKTYLGNPDFGQDTYDNEIAAFEDAFYPQAGYEEENQSQYFSFVDDIRNSGYSESVQRQLIEKLDETYVSATGKAAPDAKAIATAQETVEETGETASEGEDRPGLMEQLGGLVEDVLGWFDGDKEQKNEEDKSLSEKVIESVVDPEWLKEYREEQGPKQEDGEANRPHLLSDLPEGVSHVGTYASAGRSDGPAIVKPASGEKEEDKKLTSEQMVEAFEAWADSGKPQASGLPTHYNVKDDSDVLRAMFEGKLGLVDPEQASAVLKLAESPTVKQLFGTIANEQFYQFNKETIGSKAHDALMILESEDYPDELRYDGYLVLAQLAQEADQLEMGGKLPEGNGPALERYLTSSETAMNRLNEIHQAKKAFEDDRAAMLAEQEELKKQALEQARQAVMTGQASEEQVALVRENAPDFDLKKLKKVDKGFKARYADIYSWDDGYFAYGEGTGFEASDVYRSMVTDKGLTDDSDLRFHLSESMCALMEDDAETAYSLGMSLEDYYANIGGMSNDMLCQRAATRISQQGAKITDEDMQTLSAETGGDGVGWVATGGLGVVHGANSLYASYANTLYVGSSESTVRLTAARMKHEFQDVYGVMGRDMYRAQLTALINSGKLDQGYAKVLQEAMRTANDIYDVGIDPSANNGILDNYAKAVDNVKLTEAYMTENGTEGEQYWFNQISGMTRNAAQAGIAAATTIATGNPKLGFAVGYSAAEWGDNVSARWQQGYGRNTGMLLGTIDTAGNYAANIMTFEGIMGRATGANTLFQKAIAKCMRGNPAGTVKALAATKGYALKLAGLNSVAAFAENIIDEAVWDEGKEKLNALFIDKGIVPMFNALESGAEIGAVDVIGSLLGGIGETIKGVSGVAKEVAAGFADAAIGSSIFAVAGAAGAGVSTYKGTRTAADIASKASPDDLIQYDSVQMALDIANGNSVDIEGFMQAFEQDSKNTDFIAKFNAAAKQTKVDSVVAQIIATDDGSDGMLPKVKEANEQIASHETAAQANKTAMDQATGILVENNAQITAGTAGETELVNAENASMAIVKNKTGYDEHTREAMQKKEQVKAVLDEKMAGTRLAAKQLVESENVEAMQELQGAVQQKQMQQEADNLSVLDADNFIAERYPDADEEQRKQIYEQFAAARKNIEGLKSGVELLSKAKKKFGFEVKLVDDLGGAEGGYMRSSNTIYVTKDITQSEAIKRVLLHEMTHATETGGRAYDLLRNELIKFRYGDDQNALEADVTSIMNRYNDHLKSIGSDETMGREGAMQEIIANINSELLSGNEDIVKRLVGEAPSVARRVWETIKGFLQKIGAIKDTEVDRIRRVADMFEKALNEAQTQRRDFSSDGIQYSLREKEAPKNVVYAYKAFYARDGKLYPPMVANITDEADKQKVKGATSGTMKSLPTPVGVWLDADVGGIMTDESGEPVRAKDTKRLRVKNDKSGGSATLAFRPGWHLGEWPDAKQFNKADPETGERGKRMPDDLVFAKCEVSADIDYQLDALSYGINEKGGFSRSQAGLPEVPVDGYYKYRTNVDPTTAPWLIAGSIKVTEILDDDDCARICAEYGVTPDKRVSGEKIDLAKYGLKRGPVEETTEGMEKFKENDANRANKALLDRALSDPNYPNAYVQRDIDFDNPAQYEQLQKEFAMNGQDIEQYRKLYETRGFASERRAQPIVESKRTKEPLVGEVKGSAIQYSLRSWTEDERDTVRENLTKRGFAATDVERWIGDVDGVARIIAADRDRLDFKAADNQVMLKPNQEYVKTLDASTLCAKRLIYQGTFNAIQHAMPDKVITSDGLIKLRNMMAEMGYETPCGICYVESRRRNLGTFAKQWLDGYDANGGYQPKLDDVTTTDGLERMRTEHPEVYKSFTDEMNRKGSNNPKVVQLRTDYRGDIRNLTKKQAEKIVEIGGLRVQSFSDFETPHLLDMMQAVLDMTEKGLTSQAYTKVPDFAAVFGDTGIKINLSLIADGNGLDENGNLVFSSYEGMDFDRAMELRDMYSKNVGTILVGVNDAHIKAAMADPRIDYIIPFHKSGWGQKQLESLTGMRDYEDYTADQNEKRVKGETKGGKAMYKNVEENFHPVGPGGYWEFDKTGNENAAKYLRMCEEDGRIPKFSPFLTKDTDGHWVSPDGYWKLLIDFKMYDNDGNGSPQMPVQPNFNMTEAERILDEYEGGANELPVAEDVVERYVKEFDGMQFSIGDKKKNPMTKQDFGSFYAKVGEMKIGKTDQFARAANGDYILAIKNKLVYTDGNWNRPSISSVVEILLDDETDIDAMREVWYEYENGNFSEDTAIAIGESLHQKEVFRRSDFGYSGRDQYSSGGGQGSGSEKNPRGNGRVKYSLPSDNLLGQEIADWQTAQRRDTDQQQTTQRPTGERQFTTKTLQESQAVPQWAKDALYNNPETRYYETDTNNDQIVRSWERLQNEGYEAMRDRLLAKAAKLITADDVADANMILAAANREGDTGTFLEMAAHYAVEGTREAQALQARKIFQRMTPTGMKVWAAGQSEKKLGEYIAEHRPIMRQMNKRANAVAAKLKDLKGGDELLRLQAAGTYTLTSEDARWGIPLNEKQRALIKEYGLEKVARPGDNYNRATLKQRMLEAILAEPNPENVTGNGLNLIQRLELMNAGAAVITNADLDYMGRQMAIYAHSPVDDQDGRIGDLALARAYEAYGNITPSTNKEKRRTWRYMSTLLSLPSAGRNVIGNATQNAVNAASHKVAEALDSLVGAVTGERTVAGLTASDRAAGWQAFVDETKNTFRDFYVDKAVTSKGEDRFNLNQRGRVFESDALEAIRLTEGFLMSVGDRNFWKKAYVNSLAEQQRVAELNGEAFDYEAACEIAEAEANYATFNEDSSVRNLLSQIKNPPEDASEWRHMLAFAVDYLMPFTGVPTNITKRMIQYSPAGLLVSAVKHGARAMGGKNFDQRDFVMGMSRGLTGTALFAFGAEMFKAGLLMLGTGEEEDKKIYGAETAQGRQYTPYIRIGDEYISLSTFMPAASALIMGATAADVFKNDEDALEAMKSACFSSMDMIFDASYMSALADVFGGYGTIGENAVDSLVNSTISMNVPALLGQIAQSMDPYVRDTKDKNAIMQALKSGLIAKIPGLRTELLEAKVDITGEKVANKKQYIAWLDPFTRTDANDDSVLQELIDIAREEGDSGAIPELLVKSNKYTLDITKTQAEELRYNRVGGEYQAASLDLTDEEKWQLNEAYGKMVYEELSALIASNRWKRKDNKERIKRAKEIIAEAKLDVIEDFLKKRKE